MSTDASVYCEAAVSVLQHVARSLQFRTPEDAEDFKGEAWVFLLARREHLLAAFRADSSLYTYLSRVVIRYGYRWLNSAARARARHSSLDTASEDEHLLIDSTSPHTRFVAHEQWRLLNRLVRQLPPTDQLLLRYELGGLSASEIAARMGVSRSAVYVRWSRLQRHLRRCVQGGSSGSDRDAHSELDSH